MRFATDSAILHKGDISIHLAKEKIEWMKKSRVVLIPIVYSAFVLVYLASGRVYSLLNATILAVVAQAFSLIIYHFNRESERVWLIVMGCLAFDFFTVTTAVHLTGGVRSPFSWMFALIVIAVAIFGGSSRAYTSALFSAVALSLLLVLEKYGVLPAVSKLSFPLPGWNEILTQVAANLALYLSVAFLAGRMSERLTDAVRSSNNRSEMLARISVTDNLTGLYNQRYFIERLEAEVARAERTRSQMCVAFLDLDNFKQVNDTEGHQAGDELLQRVGGIVAGAIRKGIDTAFRYGGDEVVIILGETDLMNGIVVVDRIRAAVHGLEEELTFSVGIAEHIPGKSAEELLGAADHAMYEAKARGGNAVVASDWDIVLTGGT